MSIAYSSAHRACIPWLWGSRLPPNKHAGGATRPELNPSTSLLAELFTGEEVNNDAGPGFLSSESAVEDGTGGVVLFWPSTLGVEDETRVLPGTLSGAGGDGAVDLSPKKAGEAASDAEVLDCPTGISDKGPASFAREYGGDDRVVNEPGRVGRRRKWRSRWMRIMARKLWTLRGAD